MPGDAKATAPTAATAAMAMVLRRKVVRMMIPLDKPPAGRRRWVVAGEERPLGRLIRGIPGIGRAPPTIRRVTDRYLTIARDGHADIEVKRSRFRCTLVRVDEEGAARAVVDRLRREHWDARHHCSAFVLGPDGSVQRSSDDGEPAGTAGAPMLEVLRGRDVSDVVAVVSRWFGGVLLGAGGLVRAYGDAVRAGLDEVGVIMRERVDEVELCLDHADAARVESELRARGVGVLGVEYAAQATLLLGVPPVDADRCDALVAELTAGRARPRRVGSRWRDTAS